MTPLSSLRQNTANHFSNTSTTRTHISNSQWKNHLNKGTLPFLDTLVTILPNNTFTTLVYRKPTHTDQYLHWDSSHFITAKQSVYTLAHRAKVVSSNQEAQDKEFLHIRKALQACQFPNWALNQLQHKFHRNNQSGQHNNNSSSATTTTPLGTSPLWSPTYRVQEKRLKKFVRPKGY